MIDHKDIKLLYMLADRQRFHKPNVYDICLFIGSSKATFKRNLKRLRDLGIAIDYVTIENPKTPNDKRGYYLCTDFNWIDPYNLIAEFRRKL